MLLLGFASTVLAVAGTTADQSAHLHARYASTSTPSILKRVENGGACGPDAGYCNEGLCCSQNGVCGTGGAYCTAPGCQLAYGPACHGNIIPNGPDTTMTPRYRLGDIPYGIDITACTTPGTMALTFDDGPYHWTNELLDLLSRNGVPVTFFITGVNGAKGPINDPSTGQPDTLRRMIAEGHQIASHSWSHEDMQCIDQEQKDRQIYRNEIALADIFGFFPTYYRPPYTSCGADCIAELGTYGYHVVNYNLDTKDWAVDVHQAKQNYADRLAYTDFHAPGVIALAHDIHETTVNDLTQFMIDKARSQGYHFVTVGQCLGDPEGNWYRDATGGGPVDKAAIVSASVKKGGLKEKEKEEKTKGSGTIRTSTPAQSSLQTSPQTPSRFSAQPSTTQAKFNPTVEEAKPFEVDAEFDDDHIDSEYTRPSSAAPMGSPMDFYVAGALIAGVTMML